MSGIPDDLRELLDAAWEMGMRPLWDAGETCRLTEILGPNGGGWAVMWQDGDDQVELRVSSSTPENLTGYRRRDFFQSGEVEGFEIPRVR